MGYGVKKRTSGGIFGGGNTDTIYLQFVPGIVTSVVISVL